MKTVFVADLKSGQPVTSLFLVRDKEIRSSASGKAWLQLELGDRTGTIDGKMWDNFEDCAATFERDDVLKIQARVKEYRGRNELTIERLIRAEDADYQLEDFLPHTKLNVDQMFAQLQEIVAVMSNPWLQRLLRSVLEDPAIAAGLKRAPAAVTMHHAYIGGLLEHILSLCGLVRAISAHYPEANPELLLAAAMLHDVGKTQELSYVRAFSYSTEGELLGHIVIGLALVRKKIEAIPDFPRPLAVLVEHLVVSHHGSYEFGSPRLPMSCEAVLFHYLDDLDSKMGAMRATLGGCHGDGDWSERNPSLRRALLRTENFLRAGETNKERAAAAPAPAKAAAQTPTLKLF
jgi:3'-5' exoribonuclease